MRPEYLLYDAIESIKNVESTNKSKDASLLFQEFIGLSKKDVHILIVGASGSGKSETINALLKDGNINQQKAISKNGSDSITMNIETFKIGNCVIYDSPGLGDNLKLESEHISKIKNKLLEINTNNEQLIDLVIVVLNAGNLRNLKSEYQLINEILLPNLKNKEKLIIALNKIDLFDDGYDWDKENNKPTIKLITEIEIEIRKLKRKIKESTGIDVEPIYYSAGREDKNKKPWNLIKLYSEMNRNISNEKRTALSIQINNKKDNFENCNNFEKEKQSIKNDLQNGIENSIRQKLYLKKVQDKDKDKEYKGWLPIIGTLLSFAAGIFSW